MESFVFDSLFCCRFLEPWVSRCQWVCFGRVVWGKWWPHRLQKDKQVQLLWSRNIIFICYWNWCWRGSTVPLGYTFRLTHILNCYRTTRTNILHLDKRAFSCVKGGFSHGKLKSGRTPSSCSFEVCRGATYLEFRGVCEILYKNLSMDFCQKRIWRMICTYIYIFRYTVYIYIYVYICRREIHILFCSTAFLVHGSNLRRPQVAFQDAFVFGLESWNFQIFPTKEIQVIFLEHEE